MDAQTRKSLIAKYKDGYRVVAEALVGAKDAELDTRPGAGKWTAREVVHHLADSEMTSAVRLRLLLAVDKPVINGYDQDEFARRLHYERPIEASLEAFKAARRTTGDILDCMTDADWGADDRRTIVVFLNGEGIHERDALGEPIVDYSFLLLFNPSPEQVKFMLPAEAFGRAWEVVVDTADPLLAAAADGAIGGVGGQLAMTSAANAIPTPAPTPTPTPTPSPTP